MGVTLPLNCQRCGPPGGVLSGATTRSVSFASNSGDIMGHMVDSVSTVREERSTARKS